MSLHRGKWVVERMPSAGSAPATSFPACARVLRRTAVDDGSEHTGFAPSSRVLIVSFARAPQMLIASPKGGYFSPVGSCAA